MKIKLIALDLDGTALQNDHKSISERTKQAIKSAIARNIPVIPASGRICTVLPSAITSISGIDSAVTSNGSVLYSLKNQKSVCSSCIPARDALWVLNRLPPQIWVEIWRHGKIYVAGEQLSRSSEYLLHPFHVEVLRKIGTDAGNLISFVSGIPGGIEKINLPLIPPSIKPELLRLLSESAKFSLVDTGAGLEIMHSNVSKAFGLQSLCRCFLKIRMENVLAIGDSENDIEMLQACGVGVAMGNAGDCVKQAANDVTLSNDRDGAARAIEKYAL
ncbi:MAG TPA: HAD family hydrolase [Caproiciproducens sp.]|nr:HAD family hydrolase [Caproiciproducens sp.]